MAPGGASSSGGRSVSGLTPAPCLKRKTRLSECIKVSLAPDTYDTVYRLASQSGLSLAGWVRVAIDREIALATRKQPPAR